MRDLQVPDVLSLLQAGAELRAYSRTVPLEGTMLYWLKQAAVELRESADRKQVHVAASMDADQSTIYRFEKEDGWPESPDLTIAAYAEDLGLDARDIWARALDLWRKSDQLATVDELQRHKRERAASRSTQATSKARRASRARQRESGAGPEAKERSSR